MKYESFQTGLDYLTLILFTLAVTFTALVIYKLRGIKIKRFQLWTIILYLVIYIVAIIWSLIDIILDKHY